LKKKQFYSYIYFLDFIFALCGMILLIPIFILLLFLCNVDTGSPIFVQKRVGQNLKIFKIFKFRTMKIKTLSKATHLVNDENITRLGYFLRKFKLDELPQLINIIKGEMSFVGPRPCLVNQIKLINERKKKNVFKVRPGITGLAQIKSITMETPSLVAQADSIMIKQLTLYNYLYYIILTLLSFLNFKIFKKK
jgi:lipopolysaccharide/colanic/teichoic acid biosynthesis glycosyltransferase